MLATAHCLNRSAQGACKDVTHHANRDDSVQSAFDSRQSRLDPHVHCTASTWTCGLNSVPRTASQMHQNARLRKESTVCVPVAWFGANASWICGVGSESVPQEPAGRMVFVLVRFEACIQEEHADPVSERFHKPESVVQSNQKFACASTSPVPASALKKAMQH